MSLHIKKKKIPKKHVNYDFVVVGVLVLVLVFSLFVKDELNGLKFAELQRDFLPKVLRIL